MTSTSEEGGGIAAVNRMLLPALVEIARERALRLAVLSLQGTPTDRPAELLDQHIYQGFGGSRRALALALLRWSRVRPVFFFERVGLALPLLPLVFMRLARTAIFAHGSENWKAVRWIDKWSIRLSELIITNSDFTLRKMKKRFPRLRAEACPLGLSTSFVLRAEPAEPAPNHLSLEACDGHCYELRDRVLLLVGRLHQDERQKGHDVLIRVLPGLLARCPDVQLVCPGPGNDRSTIVRLARETGVASSVFVPGFLTTPELERLYQRCYAFVMPSRQEGFGLVYLEAMNFAKPCVGCFDDGAEDIIVDGETGYLLHDAGNLDEVLAIVSRLVSDPDLARSLGRNGFERLHKHFRVHGFQNRFRRILGQVLGNSDTAAAA